MRTIILGLDAFDPNVFERLAGESRLPNLSRLAEKGGFSRFGVANPPQSEVSWTSIATGLNPAGHGIFDFVHRDPKSYGLYVSLLPAKKSMGGTQFVPPHSARTLFEQATRKGYEATSFWWPATFPARPESMVRTFPGLGTPDIQGKLGVGSFFTSDNDFVGSHLKTAVGHLVSAGRDRWRAQLKGPQRQGRDGVEDTMLPLEIELAQDDRARLRIGDQFAELKMGAWSSILELTFKVGLLFKTVVITRAILTQVHPEVRLYLLPLQIHPLHSPWRYATPPGFVKEIWKATGPFLTVGWPQDTTGLEDGCISDEQFIDLCKSVDRKREQVLLHSLKTFREGLHATVMDTLDRVQHMFWRDRMDVVEGWYIQLDELVGKVEAQAGAGGGRQARLLVVSDHGFTNFTHKAHLNRWLMDRGYLVSKSGGDSGKLHEIDWSRSQAYAIGLNSLYLNRAGREGQGIVAPDQADPLLDRIRQELRDWKGPDGGQVVRRALSRDEVFSGPLAEYGPDALIGYAPGYRGSAQTGLGGWEKEALETNSDHWTGDHCIDAEAVPGSLFASHGLKDCSNPSYLDFPRLAIGEDLEGSGGAPPRVSVSEEDAVVEERLKSLGYL